MRVVEGEVTTCHYMSSSSLAKNLAKKLNTVVVAYHQDRKRIVHVKNIQEAHNLHVKAKCETTDVI